MSVRPEEALRAKALATSGVTNLIGATTAMRWYPNAAPQGVVYPCVVCDVAEDNPVNHLSGSSGWTIARIALRIYGVATATITGYVVCQNVAEQLRIALAPTKAEITVGGETVLPTIILESQSDTPAGTVEGTDKPVYGITQNYTVSMAQATS